MQKKVLLIDSFGVLFRSYFALERTGLAKRDGTFTFALYGFFKAFFKAVQEIQPTEIIFALESRSSRRKEIDPNYKAHRKEQPQALLDQIAMFYDILEKSELPHMLIEGYEADDVLSVLSLYFQKQPHTDVYIYSSDKDLVQLVGNGIYIVQPSKTIAQPLQILGISEVKEKFGVFPHQIRDYLAIVGDVSDNIKGVTGIGPKTASKLLEEYDTLEKIYENLHQLSSGNQKKFEDSREAVKLSQELVSLYTDYSSCTDNTIGKITRKNVDVLSTIFKDLEFSPFKEISLLYNITGESSQEESLELFSSMGDISESSLTHTYQQFSSTDVKYIMITTYNQMLDIAKQIEQAKYVCFDTETTGLGEDAEILGVSLCIKAGESYYIPLQHTSLSEQINILEFIECFGSIFRAPDIYKIGHNIKFDYKILQTLIPEITGPYFDTMIASYLLQPDSKQYSLDDISLKQLYYQKISYKSLVDGKKISHLGEVDIIKVTQYACEDADITYQLYLILKEQIAQKDLNSIFFNLEMPLIPILANMEKQGIGVDIPYFQSLELTFQKKLDIIATSIKQVVGEDFNMNSPKQVSSLLYEKLKLPKPKSAGRSKSIFATDEESLQLLSEFAIVQDILEYRKYHKLQTTYVIPMQSKAKFYGTHSRIHTSFQQTGTATGRLSSTNPNLQNIPVKDEAGVLIRKGFISAEGHTFISLDYSQIELRLMAHFSNDQALIQAFQNEQDIHRATASQIFNKSLDEVTAQERNIAKTINFGIIYGMGSTKLAKEIHITNAEAKDFILTYFHVFKGVRDFIATTKEIAHKQEYVTTLLGRKRFLPDINSTNPMFIAMNERMAVNTIIQGSNADLLKKCMIKVTAEQKLKQARLLLQIHDELIFEVPEKDAENIGRQIQNIMEDVYKLSVPLKSSLHIAKNWGSLK